MRTFRQYQADSREAMIAQAEHVTFLAPFNAIAVERVSDGAGTYFAVSFLQATKPGTWDGSRCVYLGDYSLTAPLDAILTASREEVAWLAAEGIIRPVA
jgi:hypothetical protein